MSKKDIELISYEIPNDNIKTNILCVDCVLNGGIIPGTTIQFVSESGLGKSTLCLEIAKNLCYQEMKVLYLDAEGSVTQNTLSTIGITEYMINNTFYYVRESTFGNVEKVIDKFLESINFDLVIIDSIAALINDDFLDSSKSASITTNNSNLNSRPLTLFLNKYNSIAKKRKISFIFINQYRNKVDMKIGTVLKEYGGKSVRYNSDVILKIIPLKSNGKNRDFSKLPQIIPGNKLELEIIKSNRIIPGLKIPFYLVYGRGVSELYQKIYALIKLKIINENNSYYKYTINGVTYRRHGFEELYYSIINQFLDDEVMSKIREFYIK